MNTYYVEWKDFNNRLRQGLYEAVDETALYFDVLNLIAELSEVVKVELQ